MTYIVLPLAAARILGYTESHMRNLHAYGVLSGLVHYAGRCGGAYYIYPELLAFKRQVRMDPDLAALIVLLNDDE